MFFFFQKTTAPPRIIWSTPYAYPWRSSPVCILPPQFWLFLSAGQSHSGKVLKRANQQGGGLITGKGILTFLQQDPAP